MYRYSRRLGELAWYPGVCLATKEVAEQIANSPFTGIELREVELFEKENCRTEIEGYVELRFTGRVKVDHAKSGMEVKYECPLCGVVGYSSFKESSGLHFIGEENEWPDAFMMEPTTSLFFFLKPAIAQFLVDLRIGPMVLTKWMDT